MDPLACANAQGDVVDGDFFRDLRGCGINFGDAVDEGKMMGCLIDEK